MKYLFTIIFSLFILQVNAETKTYAVYHGDKEVGTLVADKIMEGNGNKMHYQVTSDLKVRIIISIKSFYSSQVTYLNDALSEATAKELRNDDVKRNTSTKATGNGYSIITTKETFSIDEKITYSDCLLQFEEPIGVSKIYSESLGTFASVEEIEPNKYLVTSSNGDKSEYHYENGECIFFKYLHPLATLQFKLKK